MLSKAASSTIFWVFGMTWPGIELQPLEPLVNPLLIRPMDWKIYIIKSKLSKLQIGIYHSLHTSRMWHKEFYRLELRVFLLLDWLPYQGKRAQFCPTIYPLLKGEELDSYFSQGHLHSVKRKKPHPGFEHWSMCPFLMMIPNPPQIKVIIITVLKDSGLSSFF